MKRTLRLRRLVIGSAWFLLGAFWVDPALAQDPTPWQMGATGLVTQQNEEGRTAGLGFIVTAQDWPSVVLRGGVENAESYRGPKLDGPTGIELGQISVSDGTGGLVNETVDWAHNKMTFGEGASQLDLWVTRLSPSIVIQSQADTLAFFTGDVAGNEFFTNQSGGLGVRSTLSPSYPKYVAFPVSGGVSVQALSASATSLSTLDRNWLLLWYGDSSHFLDTKVPLSYEWTVPFSSGYEADTPLLLVFEHNPTSIRHLADGGIEVSFASTSGHVVILPLFGRETLRISETETWSQGLPGDVLQKAQWWAEHLCSYPISVSETYAHDGATDRTTITENVTYLSVCSGGTLFAPLPPMLSIAKDALGVSFSGSVVDGDLATEYGPMLGIEGTQQYSWNIDGLKRYVDAQRVVLDVGEAPAELEQDLASEVQKVIGGGHFAPWIFLDGLPRYGSRGDLYWGNPADTLYQLIEVAETLDNSELKDQLIDYLQSERSAYPPEDVFNLDLTEGTVRGPYSYIGSNTSYIWDENASAARHDAFLRDVPLYSYYALARYYELTVETLPTEVWDKAEETLDRAMSEQDWASLYWFDGFADRRVAVTNANRHFAGLVGYVRLAGMAGDLQAESLGRALLGKAAILRLAMAEYPRYLYDADLVELPPESDWQPNYVRHPLLGYLYNYDWTGPYDDARQVAAISQYEVLLHDHSGFEAAEDYTQTGASHLVGFVDVVPELGRFLRDYAQEDVEIYIDTVETLIPHWYAAFSEGTLGQEHNLSHPIDSYQIFMAKALIQQETPDKLATHVDIPWLQVGDLFYMQKLAEAIRAYHGQVWTDTITLGATPGNQTVYLSWTVYDDMPPGCTWQIDYDGPTGNQPSPISGIASATWTYALTGLRNYTWYTVTLSAMSGGTAFLTSDPVRVMPTDHFVYLPLLLRKF